MTVYSMFLTFAQYLVGFILFVPAKILWAVGLLLPTCDDMGIVGISANWVNEMTQWARTFLPLTQLLPIDDLWVFANVVVTYIILKWIIKHIPWLMHLGAKVWIAIIVIYLIIGAVDWLANIDWSNAPAFNEAFGGAPSSTWSGGGLGGGGGGSW